MDVYKRDGAGFEINLPKRLLEDVSPGAMLIMRDGYVFNRRQRCDGSWYETYVGSLSPDYGPESFEVEVRKPVADSTVEFNAGEQFAVLVGKMKDMGKEDSTVETVAKLPPQTSTPAYRYIEHVETMLSSLELHLLYLALTETNAPRPKELDEPINAFYDMHPREMVSALFMLGLKIKWHINAVSDDPIQKICAAKNG